MKPNTQNKDAALKSLVHRSVELLSRGLRRHNLNDAGLMIRIEYGKGGEIPVPNASVEAEWIWSRGDNPSTYNAGNQTWSISLFLL